MDDYNSGNIKIRKVLIFVVIVVAILGLTLWGGTSIGRSQATTDTQDLADNLSQTQNQLSQITTMSASLQTKLTNAQDDYSQLQSQFTALQDVYAALQAQFTSDQQNLLSVQTQLTTAQQNVVNLRAQLANSQQSSAALQTQLATALQNAATLQNQLTQTQSDLDRKLAALDEWNKWFHSAPFAPALVLSPASGPAGSGISVNGNNFTAGSSGVVFFDTNRNGALDSGEPNQNVTVSASGTFTATLIVPSAVAGVYPVMAAFPAGSSPMASINFAVTAG